MNIRSSLLVPACLLFATAAVAQGVPLGPGGDGGGGGGGGGGGTASNATSGVAPSSTNTPTVSYSYGFNGTTWDQLQVDASKYLKVNVETSSLPTGAATATNQANPKRWIAGNGYGTTWTAVFGTEVNSIVNGNSILSSIVVANQTALDTYISISASFGSITTTSGAPYFGIYICPLNQDGTTYCDGRFASSAAGPPLSQYYLCSLPLIPSVTQAQVSSCGSLQPIPPGAFKLVEYNLSGATEAASGNTISAQTYNLAFH